MKSLAEAIEAADKRKLAAFDADAEGTMILGGEAGGFEELAVFSGLDVDIEELRRYATGIAAEITDIYVQSILNPSPLAPPLYMLIRMAWSEGVLVGLLTAQQSEETT